MMVFVGQSEIDGLSNNEHYFSKVIDFFYLKAIRIIIVSIRKYKIIGQTKRINYICNATKSSVHTESV